jgi:hypothetical protein
MPPRDMAHKGYTRPMNKESECEDTEIRNIRKRGHSSHNSYVFGEVGVF